MLKKIKTLLVIILIIVSIGTLSGCKFAIYYPEYESGFYRYAVETKKDGTKRAYLIGLTESGAQQKELIYPETIDGIPVYGIGYVISVSITSYKAIGDFSSDKLEKIFFPTMPKEVIKTDSIFDNLQADTRLVYWNSDYINRIGGRLKSICGYNYVEDYYSIKFYEYLANVSYMLNYENAPNNGYYWVDSYDESIISFIPPAPNREGFQFDGWYKEPECVIEWKFEKNRTDKENLLNGDSFDSYGQYNGVYDGIYLYAKWIKV